MAQTTCGASFLTWMCRCYSRLKMIFKSQCSKGTPWSFSSSQDMTCENEDIIRTSEDMLNITKSMLDPCGPNDDMWRKFALPLTPPNSPPRTYGESSESEESTDDSCCDNAERLQDVSENLDSTFDAEDYRNFWRLTEAINIRSKLISDCMWSGEEVRRLSYTTSITPSVKKLSVEIQEDLFPTPCPSPPASVTSTDCLSSTECVDPTTVFPFSLSSESSSGQSSDSEEEIDVVTIDTKPLKISIGHKRKPPQRTTIRRSTVRSTPQRSSGQRSTLQQRSAVQRPTVNNTTAAASSPQPKTISQPIIRRVMSEPTSPTTPPEKNTSRKTSNLYKDGDSSDPDRRSTHNILERRRRIDLKKSFEKLRECVPNLENREKSPKVLVLRRAADYIDILTKQDLELEGEKLLLQKEKQVLIEKLKKLTRGKS